MENKVFSLCLALILIASLNFLYSIPLTSAENINNISNNSDIIEITDTTSVGFQIINSTENYPGLEINIISPTNRTYRTCNINIKVETNLDSQCYYSIDNSEFIELGSGTFFSKLINVSKGSHTLTIKCQKDSRIVYKTVSFSYKPRISTTSSAISDILQEDKALEEQLSQRIYSDWSCINNRLQRTVTHNGASTIEYSQVCGLKLPASAKKMNLWFYIIPLILFILILIILVILLLVFFYKK